MKMNKLHIWIVGIASFILIASLGAFGFVYNNKDKNLNIDGHYQAVYSDGEFGIEDFIISGNHLIYNDYDFRINRADNNTFVIKSIKDAVYLRYNDDDEILELYQDSKSALYINDDNFINGFNFEHDIYLDINNSSTLLIQDSAALVQLDMNSGETQLFNYDSSDAMIRLQNTTTNAAEYYYIENNGDLAFYDIHGNEIYSYTSPASEYSLSGYMDILDNSNNFDLDINSCKIVEFGDNSFAVSPEGKLYQSEIQGDAILIIDNDKTYYYYAVNPAESTIYGSYSTDDVSGMLILAEDGSGNLTLDGMGLDFQYVVYDKYIKCTDISGNISLIPYSISNTGMEISITVSGTSGQEIIQFYKLRDNTDS